MSDLYLVLRSRLDVVKDWVELGTQTMRDAREAQGLSYEAVARQIPVASKTYERWEKRGAVPRPFVVKVAGILDLEVEIPERVKITIPAEPEDQLAVLREEDAVWRAEVNAKLDEILRRIA